MAEDDNKRYFQIMVSDAKFAQGPMKGKRIENTGRYESKTPLSAGKKAAGRIFRDAGVSSATFILRETTSGSSKLSFVYFAEKRKLKDPKKITRRKKLDDGTFEEGSDVVLTITHQNHVEAILGESEKRAVYKKLDIPFPSDTVVAAKNSKKSSKKSSGKSRTRTGGGIADTAYPVRESSMIAGSTSTMGMDSHYTMDGSDYKPSMTGGSTQCCQTSPVNFDGKILGGTEAMVAASASTGSDQVKLAMDSATAASRERFLNSL
jgi:hypothetical protein